MVHGTRLSIYETAVAAAADVFVRSGHRTRPGWADPGAACRRGDRSAHPDLGHGAVALQARGSGGVAADVGAGLLKHGDSGGEVLHADPSHPFVLQRLLYHLGTSELFGAGFRPAGRRGRRAQRLWRASSGRPAECRDSGLGRGCCRTRRPRPRSRRSGNGELLDRPPPPLPRSGGPRSMATTWRRSRLSRARDVAHTADGRLGIHRPGTPRARIQPRHPDMVAIPGPRHHSALTRSSFTNAGA
jgi:hypothetical protein